jgi:hypothetical protein
MRFAGLCLACCVVTLLSGCSDAPDLVQIQGLVNHGGKPVPNIIVQFQPEDGRPSVGQADAEGKFKLTYSKHYEGARLGKHRVFVAFPNSTETPYDESGRQKLNADQQAIIQKYGQLETTPLEVELTENGQVVEIKLD